MEYTVMFMVQKKSISSNPLVPILAGYDWWVDLAQKALKCAEEFEMEGIESAQKFGKQVPNNETKELVFRGKMSPQLEQEILTDYLTKEGYIKWFTLILKKEHNHIFTSSHYGDETYISLDTKEQVDAIQEWAKKYPSIWRVDVFECD